MPSVRFCFKFEGCPWVANASAVTGLSIFGRFPFYQNYPYRTQEVLSGPAQRTMHLPRKRFRETSRFCKIALNVHQTPFFSSNISFPRNSNFNSFEIAGNPKFNFPEVNVFAKTLPEAFKKIRDIKLTFSEMNRKRGWLVGCLKKRSPLPLEP